MAYLSNTGLTKLVELINTRFATKDELTANNKDTNRTVEYIVGTQTAATPSFTGVSQDSSLYDGKCINYYLPFAGTSAGDTLNLTLADGTKTGAKPIYIVNSTRLTTHYAAGTVFTMTYSATKDAWYCGNYWTDGNTYDRNLLNDTRVTAGTNKIMNFSLIMEKADGTWESFTTTSGTGTTKTRNTSGFQLGKIWVYNYNETIAANALTRSDYIYDCIPCTLTYSTNCGTTLVAHKPVYLVGTIGTDGLFYLDVTWWTQTEPTTEDGKVYIYLGNATSTSVIYKVAYNPIYEYRDGAFQQYNPIRELGTAAYQDTGHFALASHGNHVPATQTANNKVFLRNDNTWQTITPANIGALATTGTAADSSKLGGTAASNYALKTYVDSKVADLVNSAPATLDTLAELSTALGNDPNFATTIATQIGGKADAGHTHNYAGSASAGGPATSVAIAAATTNADRYVWFSDSSDNKKPVYDTDFKYNPSTNNLTVTKINGVAVGTAPKFTDTTYTITSGTANGTISVNGTDVSVKGLKSYAYTDTVYEANIAWGGKNFSASYGCIDAAMVDELGANRFMFAKADGITVEYTRDGGTNWEDYGLTNAQKVGLFSSGSTIVIGKANNTDKATEHGDLYQLRVTIDTGAAKIYTALNKFVLYVSTSGSANSVVTIQRAIQSTPDNFIDVVADVPISGWSGYNVVNTPNFTTYGNSPTSQNGRVRFIFKANGGNTNNVGLSVYKIMGFGGVGWTTPSTMAKTGHLYSFDADQNATFPAKVTATGDITSSGNMTAEKFIGALGVSPTARPASANVTYGDGGLRHYLASASMTTGKPPSDANIIHLAWDNIGKYDGQIATSTSNNNLYWRTQNGSATWGPWKTAVATDDLSAVATSGSYSDLTDKPSSFPPTTHNQASNTINALTGYSKPSSTSALAASDTLNAALGKLEKALDGKQASGSYAAASHTHNYAGSASAGGPANAVARETSTTPTNSNRTIWFSQSSDATKLAYDDSFTYNPSTDNLTVTKINGVTVGSSPKFTDTVYTHPTSAGNIHLPSGGASGNFLKWSSAGTGKWESLTKAEVTTALGYTPPTTNTTYSNMTAATASAAGKTGLVPAPAAGAQDKFLRGNATWATASDIINTLTEGSSPATADDYVVCQYAGGGTTTTTYHRRPVSKVLDALTKAQVTTALGYTPPTTNTTYSNMTAATADAAGKAGLVPAPGKGKQTSFLRGDGTWVVPTNTTYSNMTAATADAAGKAGLVPAPAAGKQTSFLRGDGTWVVPTNTTNSAGAGNSTSKLFLVGTTAQSTGTSYSNANVYATNGALHATSISTGGNVVVGGTADTNYLQLPSGIKLY